MTAPHTPNPDPHDETGWPDQMQILIVVYIVGLFVLLAYAFARCLFSGRCELLNGIHILEGVE